MTMKKRPLVTIIITCYNYGKYVETAIQSALDQTYDNIQLIVINDGSTDASHEVISRLNKDGLFTYIEQENKGIVATRNLGISMAKGDYQMQLDADDYVDKDYVKKCVTLAESGYDIVYTQVRHFGKAEFQSQFIEYDLEKLKHDNYMHAASLIRVSLLGESPYDPYLDDKGNEDWDLVLGLCLEGARPVLLDEPLLNYRNHEAGASRSGSFQGTINETLVRHHVLSKYNDRYPEEFWYFSPQIQLLLGVIEFKQAKDQEVQALQAAIQELRSSWRLKGTKQYIKREKAKE